MGYHASSNVYATSAVKLVVDSWATSKFTNSELKTVDGYSARLITLDELTTNLGYEWGQKNPSQEGWVKTENVPSWLYNSNYLYWTMTPSDDSSDVWIVNYNGNLLYNSTSNDAAVRPVINVYKSKISS